MAPRPVADGRRDTTARAPVQMDGNSYSRQKGFEEGRGGGDLAAEFEAEAMTKSYNSKKAVVTSAVGLIEAFGTLIKKGEGELAADLMKTASQLISLAKAIDGVSTKKSEWVARISKANDDYKKAMEALAVYDAIANITNTKALEELKNNPSEATAEAWALSAAAAFESAGVLIDKVPIEVDFIKDYFKGLFGAPSAYVKAFLGIMKRRYAGIDKEAEVSPGDNSYGPNWRGRYTIGLASHADLADHALFVWMLDHKEIRGKDVPKVSVALAKDLIISELASDGELKEETRQSWIAIIGRYNG